METIGIAALGSRPGRLFLRFLSIISLIAAEPVSQQGCLSPLQAEKMKHVEAVMELMRALTNSRRFDKLPELVGERDENMFTEIFDEVEERGIEKGLKQGIVEGTESAYRQVAEDMLRGNEPLVKIVSYSRLDEGRIRELAGTLGVSVKE